MLTYATDLKFCKFNAAATIEEDEDLEKGGEFRSAKGGADAGPQEVTLEANFLFSEKEEVRLQDRVSLLLGFI